MPIAPELIERFTRGLDRRVPRDVPIGIAVSGGPDSIALLLLAARARPGAVEAATVDHRLREGSADEARFVAEVCERLGVRHSILEADWGETPQTAVQERARVERYRLLRGWATERGLGALATAHHADDQAETFLMRLARGAGIRGLAAMRPLAPTPGAQDGDAQLVRPLLGWRRSELEDVCAAEGIQPVTDPSNDDDRFERVRVRRALADLAWLDAAAIAQSAAHLASAHAALRWAASQAWDQRVTAGAGEVQFDPSGLPDEILRRLARRAVLRLASEGQGTDLRGRELDQLLSSLKSGGRSTLRGVLCSGGQNWRFIPAPNRTRRTGNSR